MELQNDNTMVVVTGGRVWGQKKKWVNWIMRYKLPVIKELILEDIMYSIIAKGGRG